MVNSLIPHRLFNMAKKNSNGVVCCFGSSDFTTIAVPNNYEGMGQILIDIRFAGFHITDITYCKEDDTIRIVTDIPEDYRNAVCK